MVTFLEYSLKSDALILGERIKGGIFRPSCKILRYSTITETLRQLTGLYNIHAVGVIDNSDKFYFTYSPRERVVGVSKIPLQSEVLTKVKGRVYIINYVKNIFPEKLKIFMGALRTKGFGECQLERTNTIKIETQKERQEYLATGTLNTRIPMEHLEKFLIKPRAKLVFGYVFKPTSETTGIYVKSLFEGSEVIGPKFLLGEINGQY